MQKYYQEDNATIVRARYWPHLSLTTLVPKTILAAYYSLHTRDFDAVVLAENVLLLLYSSGSRALGCPQERRHCSQAYVKKQPGGQKEIGTL